MNRLDRLGQHDASVIVLMLVTAIAIIFAAVRYERVERVRILDRWWESGSAVRWEESRYVCTTDRDYVCGTNYAGEQECGWESSVDCGWETRTYTRCSESNRGRELPIIHPHPGCNLQDGDFSVRWHQMYVTYTPDDEGDGRVVTSEIGRSAWPRLVPGRNNTVRVGLFGGIRGFTE